MKKNIMLSASLILLLVSCFAKESKKSEDKMNAFKSVSMKEGLAMMKNDSDYILLDVRTPEEFASGHIPGAVQLTNETFTESDAAKAIKNKEQKIYCYCRSGRRSKMSSQKLSAFGYVNIIEIGGIIDYEGKLEKLATE